MLPPREICQIKKSAWSGLLLHASVHVPKCDKKELKRRSATCRLSGTVQWEATTPAKEGLCALLTIKVLLYRFSQIHEKSHSQLCLCSRMTLAITSLTYRPTRKRPAHQETLEKRNIFYKLAIVLFQAEHRTKRKKTFRLEFWLFHFWGVWLEAIYLTFLKFTWCRYKIGVLVTSRVCCEQQAV